jgi:hypothetical protein
MALLGSNRPAWPVSGDGGGSQHFDAEDVERQVLGARPAACRPVLDIASSRLR